jgi:membrane protein DedA with SNARE-associated domain
VTTPFLLAPALQTLAIASATLVSEDLTCIAVGLLVLEGHLSAGLGIAACTLGIYLGDLGLWLLGRLGGRAVLQWPWVSRRIPKGRLAALGDEFDARAGRLILASRFLPGTRMPLYVAAGALGRRPLRFVAWALLSVILWVPLVVLIVARLGDTIVGPLRGWLGAGGAIVMALAACGGIVAALRAMLRPERRARMIAAVSRIWRWEFWPMWAFYPRALGWWRSVASKPATTWRSSN